MVNGSHIDVLKSLLRREVAEFCAHNKRKWKVEISNTIDEIKANNWQAVFFGGTLRSLLLARLINNIDSRPRDIDIVVSGVDVRDLRGQFEKYVARETRFGGVQLWRKNWQFDLWPLHRNFGFSDPGGNQFGFSELPKFTFLNLEAVAIDVWPTAGKARTIYSGDDQFFKSILTRTIELNYEENPFPELCVARTLVVATNLKWKLGPRLLSYIMTHGSGLSETDFENIQRKHYGTVRLNRGVLPRVLDFISEKVARSPNQSIKLPTPSQLSFWPHDYVPNFRFTAFSLPPKAKIRTALYETKSKTS